jgi:hypothetical protein
MSALLPFLLMLTLLPGCTLSLLGPNPLKNETKATISTKIREGVTTKIDILSAFGSFRKITRFTEDKEEWKYTYIPYTRYSYMDYTVRYPIIPGTRKELTIKFNGDVVLSYFMFCW